MNYKASDKQILLDVRDGPKGITIHTSDGEGAFDI
jgi:hypothetical protein